MDAAFTQERIDKCKAQIVLYEDLIDQLLTGTIKSFTLNTGQTVETVTKKDVSRLQESLDLLYNRCEILTARLNGGSIYVMPGW